MTKPRTTMATTRAANSQRQSRIRVRRARPLSSVIAEQMHRADTTGYAADVDHGGGVANCYGYPAYTQAIGVSVVRTGETSYRVLADYTDLPANKVTRSGAAAATLGHRAPWDERYSAATTRLDRLDLVADTLTHGDRFEL